MSKYILICGLEIHAELKTISKMFCGCPNDPFGAEKPNTYTCPVCLGMPGALPIANQTAIKSVVQLGLAVGAKINQKSKFDRKNYFYPDLAKGYQISQYDEPFCLGGEIQTSYGPVKLTRIHLEEDTAKLTHTELEGEKVTLIDFNRGGVPLAEIVSEPVIYSPEQAAEYARNLRSLIRYLGVADCDMEKGGMRLEANISLTTEERLAQGDLGGYKVEVKNINSFNFMEQAVRYEVSRQTEILERGEKPIQETRGFNPNTGKTFSQRIKEDATDYRYFPDPDLPPIEISDELLAKWQKEMPEPREKLLARWQTDYAIEERYGDSLATDKKQITWLEELWALALINKIKVNQLANFMINKKISYQVGDQVDKVIKKFQELTTTAEFDAGSLEKIIDQVLADNLDAVAKYQAGQKQVIGFFIGQIMRVAGQKLDAGEVNKILLQKLNS